MSSLHLVLALLQAPAAAQGAPPFEITQEVLDRAVRDARPAVEAAAGHPLPDTFRGARTATTAEIGSVLAEENVPVFAAQLKDEEAARAAAEAFAGDLAPALLAKYAIGESEILVSPQAFTRVAEMLGIPELESEAVVRAVVAHELVHAIDVPLYDFAGVSARVADQDRVAALNAVLEGHAQLVARAACAELGWSAAFETFTRSIGAPLLMEDKGGEGLRLLLSLRRRAIAELYSAGEAFVAALVAAEGSDGVGRALREPPRDLAEIRRPEWFLDPTSRPALAFDLERGLDRFAADYAGRGWRESRASVDGGQLRSVFEVVEDPSVERVATALRGGRTHQVQEPNDAAMHYALLCEWASATDARRIVELSAAVSRLRDDTMAKGAVRIVAADYTPIGAEGDEARHGFLVRKDLVVFGDPLEVITLVVAEGPLTLELVRSGETVGLDAVRAHGLAILREAKVRAEGPRDTGPEAPPEGGTPERGGG